VEDYSVDDGYTLEDYTPEKRKPVKWSKEAAHQEAAKISYAVGIEDRAVENQIAQDFMAEGKSSIGEELTKGIVETDKNNKIEQASYLSYQEGAESTLPVLQNRLAESKDKVVTDFATARLAAQDAINLPTDSEDFDNFLQRLDNEREYLDGVDRLYQENMKFTGSTLGDIFEFLGTIVPGSFGSSVNEMLGKLRGEYGEEMFAGTPTAEAYGEPTVFSSYLAPGDTLQTIREWFTDLSPEQQYDAMQFIVDNVDESSGWLGGNDFQKLELLSRITEEVRGSYLPDEEDIDWQQGVNNAIAILDLALAGDLLKAPVHLLRARTPVGGIDRGSNLGITIRVAPETSARLQAEVLTEFSDDVAVKTGANKSDVLIDTSINNISPSSMPGVSSTVVEDNVRLSQLILGAGSDISTDLTLAERLAQAAQINRTLNETKGFTLWPNASTSTVSYITGVLDTGRKFAVNAVFGKTGTKGFGLKEIDDALKNLKERFPEAVLQVVARAHGGETRVVTEGTKQGLSKADAVKELRAELTREAGGKVPRGETKSLQGEAKNAKYDIKQAKAQIRAVKNPKSNVNKSIKQGVENRVQQIMSAGGKNMLEKTARKQAQREYEDALRTAEERLIGINERLKAGKPAQKANADLEVLNSGKLENLSTDSRKRLVELTGDRTVTSTSRQAAANAGDDFFINVKFSEDYKAGSNVFIDPNDVLVKGAKAKWLADMSTKLARHLSDSFFRAFDRSRQTEKLFNDMLKPFTHASNKVKKQVVSLLQDGAPKKGELDGMVFTADDIVARVGTDLSEKEVQAVIDGYYAVRRAADVAYQIENKALRTKLLSDNMMYVKTDDFDILAAPIGEARLANVRTAFDPKTGELVERAQIDELLKQGYRVMASKETYGTGNKVSEFILVGGDTVAAELPEQVLRYRKGYFPRIYDEQYFITVQRTSMIKNGETLQQSQIPVKTIMAATSRKEAEKLKATLQKQADDAGEKVIYDWKHDRSLTGDGAPIAAELDLHMSSGRMFFSKRGQHLEDADGMLANTLNPVEAVQRLTASAARMHNLDPVVDLMKRRWINTFDKDGALFQGKFPTSADAFKAMSKQMGNEQVASARSFWDSINIVERNILNTDWWRKSMVLFGEKLESAGANKIGEFTRKTISQRDPFSVARGATFMAMIVFNPLRQLFIQSRQFLFLSGIEPTYVLSGRVQGDAMNLMAGLANTGDGLRGASAKAMGMDLKSYNQLVEDFKATGLVAATDSHIIGRDAMLQASHEITNGFFGAAGQKALNMVKGVASATRKVGFDAGEIFNLSATYMIARRRFIRQNPGVNPRSKEALAQIAADTRSMSFGMTNVGDFAYQRGALSLPSQFFSVMHKGFLNGVVPALTKYGNKTLTKTEARRVAAGQVLLYGAAGMGLAETLDWAMDKLGIKVSPEVKQALLGGLYDTFANYALSTIFNEDTDLQFSKHLAAGGGLFDTTKTLIIDAMNGNRSLLELYGGPTTTTASRIGEALKMTGIMIGANLDGVELTDAQWKDTLEMYPRIMSGYNNYLKASAMMRHASWVDANRARVAVPSNDVEAYAAGLFGITGYKQQGFYDILKDQKKHKEYIEDIAKTFYGRVSRMISEYSRPDQVDQLEALKALIAERNVLDSFLEPNDREQVYDQVQEMIKTRMDGQDVPSMIVSAVLRDKWGSDVPKIIRGAYESKLIDETTYQNLNSMYEDMIEVKE